jgi:hypothetical protein
MNKGELRPFPVTRDPRSIEEVRRFAELAVSECDEAVRQATAVVAVELAENMVKYAAPGSEPTVGSVAITCEQGVVRVVATNRIGAREDVDTLARTIARLGNSEAAALYRSQLQTLMSTPSSDRTRLGLLRCAFEGGFELSYDTDPQTLRVIAERAWTTR